MVEKATLITLSIVLLLKQQWIYIVHFRFQSSTVIGVIYNLLQQTEIGVLKLEKLPISNIPEEIRKSDPNLNRPTHQIICNEGVILIGANSLSFEFCHHINLGRFRKPL